MQSTILNTFSFFRKCFTLPYFLSTPKILKKVRSIVTDTKNLLKIKTKKYIFINIKSTKKLKTLPFFCQLGTPLTRKHSTKKNKKEQ